MNRLALDILSLAAIVAFFTILGFAYAANTNPTPRCTTDMECCITHRDC